jgi:hypothetical protein
MCIRSLSSSSELDIDILRTIDDQIDDAEETGII